MCVIALLQLQTLVANIRSFSMAKAEAGQVSGQDRTNRHITNIINNVLHTYQSQLEGWTQPEEPAHSSHSICNSGSYSDRVTLVKDCKCSVLMAYSGYVREAKLKKLPMLHVGEAVVFVTCRGWPTLKPLLLQANRSLWPITEVQKCWFYHSTDS